MWAGGHQVLSLHSSNKPGDLSQWLWSWRQHHKHCRRYYYYRWPMAGKRTFSRGVWWLSPHIVGAAPNFCACYQSLLQTSSTLTDDVEAVGSSVQWEWRHVVRIKAERMSLTHNSVSHLLNIHSWVLHHQHYNDARKATVHCGLRSTPGTPCMMDSSSFDAHCHLGHEATSITLQGCYRVKFFWLWVGWKWQKPVKNVFKEILCNNTEENERSTVSRSFQWDDASLPAENQRHKHCMMEWHRLVSIARLAATMPVNVNSAWILPATATVFTSWHHRMTCRWLKTWNKLSLVNNTSSGRQNSYSMKLNTEPLWLHPSPTWGHTISTVGYL